MQKRLQKGVQVQCTRSLSWFKVEGSIGGDRVQSKSQVQISEAGPLISEGPCGDTWQYKYLWRSVIGRGRDDDDASGAVLLPRDVGGATVFVVVSHGVPPFTSWFWFGVRSGREEGLAAVIFPSLPCVWW